MQTLDSLPDHLETIPKIQWEKLFDIIGEIDKADTFEVSSDHFPFFYSAEVVRKFEYLAYELGIVVNFDWPAWQEGKDMLNPMNQDFEKEDLITLCKLITVIIRADRFKEGYLTECFENGTVRKIILAINHKIFKNIPNQNIMTTQQMIDELFDRLDEWRHLPAYQLERRADIFFAIYLKDIMKRKYGEQIDHLIPEFPVRLGNIFSEKKSDHQNLSYKIDYVAICNQTRRVYLIELKTDKASRRPAQDSYLESAGKNHVKNLVEGVIAISQASTSKNKYGNLLSLLRKAGWIDQTSLKYSGNEYEIIVIYIQPSADPPEENIITFKEIISYLEDKQDNFSKRFIRSLEKWKMSPD